MSEQLDPVELIETLFEEKIQALLAEGNRELATEYFQLRNMVIDCLHVRVVASEFSKLLHVILKLT